MEVHAVGTATNLAMIEQLKEAHLNKAKARPFEDPIREFGHASRVEGIVRGWLTLTIEARKNLLREAFVWEPRKAGESDGDFESRRMERWRGLCVIIQEESRAPVGVRSAENAIYALKLLFPEHNWPKPGRPAGNASGAQE